MKKFVAVMILVAIVAVGMINSFCKADVVEPLEEIFDLIDVDYEYTSMTGERNKYNDIIIFYVEYNAIIINEAGSKASDGYRFDNFNDFAAATIAAVTYLTADETSYMYIAFDADNYYELDTIMKKVAVQNLLFNNKEMTEIA